MPYRLAMVLLLTCLVASAEENGGDAANVSNSNPFAFLSQDYFGRFSRDPDAVAGNDELVLTADWRIVVEPKSDLLAMTIAGDLATFLRERMALDLPVCKEESGASPGAKTVYLSESGGARGASAGSFSIRVDGETVLVRGADAAGLRDAVVHLVDRMGFRSAPILSRGEETCEPRLGLRIGTVPRNGSYRDLVFMGYNGVMVSPTDQSTSTQFAALSTSDAIPELKPLQKPDLVTKLAERAREARRYGLKTFVALEMWDFYPADAPIFANHPGLRGAEAYFHTDRPPAGYLLCTEDPLMQRYLAETVKSIFASIPVDGALVIVGGEVFQHCFMRPSNAEKGHTNCPRCEALGAETVVANLCNGMANAAREANPEAVIVAWPYSAKHFWSADDDQLAFIAQLRPGTALLTEIEKDEVLHKQDCVEKAIWDYSIDLIGPTDRAKRQIAACKQVGAAVYLKSEPELAFEAPGLPYIPCVDRWYDRAEALAGSGADGAWVIAWFVPNQGTTSAEVYKYAWWSPVQDRETVLKRLAKRIAGTEAAADHLRGAWRYVSDAIPWSPEMPPYFHGPYYLGPAHPMCADPEADLPDVFKGRSEFATYVLTEARGDVEVFGRFYREMENRLHLAVEELELAGKDVPERCDLVFRAEEWPTRWFYHTARTHANFYESSLIRGELLGFLKSGPSSEREIGTMRQRYERWRSVLEDERENTKEALEVVRRDPRLDFRNSGAGAGLAPAVDLMRAKLDLLTRELDIFLPSIAEQCQLYEVKETPKISGP